MTGKFASSARAVMTDALRQARSEGSAVIREEHLLAALMHQPVTRTIIGRSIQVEDVDAMLAEIRVGWRRGGLSAEEADALRSLGIDLDELVDRVEAELGEGALDQTRQASRRTWRTFTSAETSLVLVAARRQAGAAGTKELTAAHLLAGLVAQPGVVADVLARRGLTASSVQAGINQSAANAVER
jgi:ATP-dependent Clp protease ATP-binding subunit ClpA